MAITTFNFFIFVAIVMIVYYFCVPKKYQWCVLLAASYVFYALADRRAFIFLFLTTVTVFLGALQLKKTGRPKLTVAIIALVNFGILASFKWWNTLADAGNVFFSTHTQSAFQLPLNSLLLPLGISFYTFQAVGYLVDVHRGTVEPERNIAKFALFVSFFPQLIQGPISRHSELAQQLYASRRFDRITALHGFQLMLWGLFKKLVIADRMFPIVSLLFANPAGDSGVANFIGIIVYTVWLYVDFSAGVDIVRGVGQMLGIIMPQNFTRPFFSTSLPEFWRRFHITLNNWWRDYLFYPVILSKPMSRLSKFVRKNVGKSAGRVINVYIAIIAVRVINGMWLGADAIYVANGLFYGIVIVLGMMMAPVFEKAISALRINTENFAWKLFQMARTFMLNCIGHMFMAVTSVSAGFALLANIVRDFNLPDIRSIDPEGLTRFDAMLIVVSLLVVLVAEIIQEKGISIRTALSSKPVAVQWAVMMLCIWSVLLFGRYGPGYDPAAFVYMSF